MNDNIKTDTNNTINLKMFNADGPNSELKLIKNNEL